MVGPFAEQDWVGDRIGRLIALKPGKGKAFD
jgi:hypothetical protein